MSRRLKAPREPKVQPKRTHPLEKAWYILKPFILYMVIKTAALLLLSLLVISVPISSMAEWVTVHSNQINAVLNALASIFAVAFLMNDFLKEVNVIGEIDIDSSFFRQFCAWMKNGVKADKDKAVPLALSASLGITSALAFNILAGIIQIQSPGYQKVEAIQYSVPIWLGLILYGLISPFVEEVVFRGLTYTRMRRFFGIPLSVIVTAVLFAGFHGNLAQFVYALCMGELCSTAGISYGSEYCSIRSIQPDGWQFCIAVYTVSCIFFIVISSADSAVIWKDQIIHEQNRKTHKL